MILRDLLDAWPLAPIGAGVALLMLFGRDPKTADEHDLSDYHEPVPDRQQLIREALVSLKRRHVVVTVESPDILPPAPAGMNAGSPLYAATLFRQWFPEDPARAAARMLREIGAVEQAKAGIRPAYATDRRDMTGAFPVVRAA